MAGNQHHDSLPVMPTDASGLEARNDTLVYQYAMRNIELTAQDNREEREHMAGNRRGGMIVLLVLIVAVFLFFIYALYLGKEAFLADVLKIILGAFGGGGIGYAIGIRRNA